ncbi:MAG: 50S ribosomal protein L17 [Bacteroidales bacterium]|nr:50S ribosomal protein L17 [Bacteroidales bacterium]OQB70931.1 MAG: 50S ribosomal protein L17 [Bacteroidetes bacterium ADurb.Bin139]HOG25022.1 50S ribosomal protein L17 [Bacteroidales bacterium]HOR11112.1 50S ribosomal protein L17 [Bacteroidales bacterium]HOZ19202.1 50S ribosomal protein L17 [Bacteroidales bacterium]
MRHRKKVNHLGRKSGHRKAMLANMASSLIIHKRIETTVAKAKALRVYVEPLITKSKLDTTHSRRTVFAYLKDKDAVSELFRVVGPKIADRPGGYTRVLKTGFRAGDAADMAMIELVDFNELALAGTTKKEEKKTTRRGRSRGSKEKVESADKVITTQEQTAADTSESRPKSKTAKAKTKPAAEVAEAAAEPIEAAAEVAKKETAEPEK